MKQNLYALLGVTPTASMDELRAACTTLLSQLPPDDAVRRLALKEALSVLGNPARRAAYDALLPDDSPDSPYDSRVRVVEAGAPSGRTPLWVGMALVVVIGGGLAMRAKRAAPPPGSPPAVVVDEPWVIAAPTASTAAPASGAK
jgi:hypothetical protein